MLQLYFLPWKQTQDFKRICHVLCSYVTGYHLQLAKVFHMTTPKSKRQKQMSTSASVDPPSVHSPSVASCTSSIIPDAELECLYKELSGKPAILSLVPGFCNEYISQQVKRAPFPFYSLHFLMRRY